MINCRVEHSRARGHVNLHKVHRFRWSEMDVGVTAVIFDNLNVSFTWAAFQQTFCEQKSQMIDSSQKVMTLKPLNIPIELSNRVTKNWSLRAL